MKKNDTLGLRLREVRKAAGFTLEDLGNKIGLTGVAIGHVERGARALSAERAEALAAALDTTPEYLLYGTEPNTLPVGAIPLVSIPVLGASEAGGWAEMIAYPDHDETIEVPQKHKHCFAVRVQGDSMTPTIPDGAAAVVDPKNTAPVHGKVYLFRDGDSSTIKRLNIDGSVHTLKPDNPKYDIRPAPSEGGIIGRIVAFYGEL